MAFVVDMNFSLWSCPKVFVCSSIPSSGPKNLGFLLIVSWVDSVSGVEGRILVDLGFLCGVGFGLEGQVLDLGNGMDTRYR